MDTKMIEYARPDGKKAPAYLAVPDREANAPGLVVIQEWWGLNKQIKAVADRLANAGYRALVPDLFRGKLTQDGAEANHLMNELDWGDALEQDVRGAVKHMKSWSATNVGVVGFCMGGALTIMAGVKIPELDACVCYYGIPPEQAADPSKVRVPIQFHFAQHDDWCTPQLVDKLEQALKRGHVPHELYRYDAKHAFANEARPEVYDPDATQLAWERTLSFFRTKLGSAS